MIFYSLGSFIADGMTRTEQNSAMVQLNIDKTTGVREFTVIPLHLYEYAPAVATRSLYTREIDLDTDRRTGQEPVSEGRPRLDYVPAGGGTEGFAGNDVGI